MRVAIVDYGAGNVPSVERALKKLGAQPERVSTAEGLATAGAIILPGVGHYAALIRALEERELREPLVDAILRGKPFLGICLGLQALYQSSEEAPELAGLGILRGKICALPESVKLPHMGWNRLKIRRTSRLLDGLSEGDYFYFAHTFAADAANSETLAVCEYGAEFGAVLEMDRICAVQFHPEKSGAAGAKLLGNFLRIAA
ncbi:MAG: imidazole glycerol phosphate synthase subunit HisH [Acidobacteria bacterium]|nr:imidazole glycerol phosphate synthase subunit HisH [Acidobacteriota bacterium]MBS1864825.1 imidazole glycerol phosphate synthase subunit HisH [Acidobacteriota bacterium]